MMKGPLRGPSVSEASAVPPRPAAEGAPNPAQIRAKLRAPRFLLPDGAASSAGPILPRPAIPAGLGRSARADCGKDCLKPLGTLCRRDLAPNPAPKNYLARAITCSLRGEWHDVC
jgi:hypothetical protein